MGIYKYEEYLILVREAPHPLTKKQREELHGWKGQLCIVPTHEEAEKLLEEARRERGREVD